ncbi:MAG: MAPEG family protein [Pseudomonadota bacterium]
MTPEILSLLVFLATIAGLLLVQPLVLARARGMAFVTSNRAEPVGGDVPVSGRLDRTVRNSIEAAVLFVPLVLMTQILDLSNVWTQWGAMIFAGARIAYAVFYASGITGLRSAAWNVGFAATGVLAFGLVTG